MSTPLDTDARSRDVMNAVSFLAVTGGFGNVTMRNIAAKVGISQGTLASHLRNRAHVLRVACRLFATARTSDMQLRLSGGRITRLLPENDAELFSERMWLAWQEQARTNPDLSRIVDDADLAERLRLHLCLSSSADIRAPHLVVEAVVDALHSTIQGLRTEMCRGTPQALPPERAQLALETASALARSSLTMASGSSAE